MRIAQLGARVWFDYVLSASNAADLPTRLDGAAFVRLSRMGSFVPCCLYLPPESGEGLYLLLARGLTSPLSS